MQLRNLFFIILFFTGKYTYAQNLTGSWEGNLGNGEFLQINIIQTGDKACGYTWDYLYKNRRSFCKALFTGSYDNSSKTWFLDGTTFIDNSGGHDLMQLSFKMYTIRGEPVLKGECLTTQTFFSSGGEIKALRLEKVSDSPANITQEMRDCVAKNNPSEPEVPLAFLPDKPTTSITDTPVTTKMDSLVIVKKPFHPARIAKNAPIVSPPAKPIPPPALPIKPTSPPLKKLMPPQRTVPVPKKVDTVKKIIPQPNVIVTPQTIPLPAEISGRKNKEIGHIIVYDKKITLNIYDNGTVDGDTVSIFYNGRLLIHHRRLSGVPIIVDLTLDKNTKLHSIVLFAENLGSIPPNTALVIFTTPSGKRYELFSSATLQQNAEIIFEYIPD